MANVIRDPDLGVSQRHVADGPGCPGYGFIPSGTVARVGGHTRKVVPMQIAILGDVQNLRGEMRGVAAAGTLVVSLPDRLD